MPVVDVVPPSGVQAPHDAAPRAAAPGFETVLTARLSAPSTLPSLSLGDMVSALAGQLAPPGGFGVSVGGVPGIAGGGVAAASARGVAVDAWGAAADRPEGISDGVGAAVLAAGERYLGVPYKWGGTSAEHGFDCSGFVQQVYGDLGVKLPRVSVDQAKAGMAVASMEEARPGDLVFWRGDGSRPNHIGIYAGAGRMLVAPRTGDVVKYQEIQRPPDGIRRVIP